MYSGNHSPSNPLLTLLQAAEHFKDDPEHSFPLRRRGIGKKQVEQFFATKQLTNAISLPYQAARGLRYSLSAAIVHVVSLGENMVGIIHPCKVYGAMAVGRPVLYLRAQPSHIADLLEKHDFGLGVSTEIFKVRLRRSIGCGTPTLRFDRRMGDIANARASNDLSQELSARRFCDALERVLR